MGFLHDPNRLRGKRVADVSVVLNATDGTTLVWNATTQAFEAGVGGGGGGGGAGGVTISNLQATRTDTEATITWTTDVPAMTQVEWGPTSSYGNATPLDVAMVTSHSVTITGLSTLTTYHFRAVSHVPTTSTDANFTTTGPTEVLSWPPHLIPVSGGDTGNIARPTWANYLWLDASGQDGQTGDIHVTYAGVGYTLPLGTTLVLAVSGAGPDVVSWDASGSIATGNAKLQIRHALGSTPTAPAVIHSLLLAGFPITYTNVPNNWSAVALAAGNFYYSDFPSWQRMVIKATKISGSVGTTKLGLSLQGYYLETLTGTAQWDYAVGNYYTYAGPTVGQVAATQTHNNLISSGWEGSNSVNHLGLAVDTTSNPAGSTIAFSIDEIAIYDS